MVNIWKILDIINKNKNRLIAKSRRTAYFYLLINLPNIINIMLKGKSLTFFTMVNPGIEYGGLLGYSKTKINSRLNQKYIAKSITFDAKDELPEIIKLLESNEINFPFIIKPDIGERSKGVKYINNYKSLINYLKGMKGKLIIEEYIDKKEEYGILYVRAPHTSSGTITSFALKSFDFKKLPEEINFSKINKKTRYINLNAYITKDIVNLFDQISSDINGFYFGRFDIKANSIIDIINGDFKIIELNGIVLSFHGKPVDVFRYDECGTIPGIFLFSLPVFSAFQFFPSGIVKGWESGIIRGILFPFPGCE